MEKLEKNHNFAVILAGGRGERFWPLSVRNRPKQFISLFGGKPLIQHAVDRLTGIVPSENIFIITSADLVATTRDVATMLPAENIIGEPMGRDTAAAVALACGIVKRRDESGVVSILTADHLMKEPEVFAKILADCFTVAEREDAIVTIGISPTFPSTGFGYIECAGELETATETRFANAVRFVEKPDESTACGYLETGRYVWNAGMFIWKVAVMEQAFKDFAPDMLELLNGVAMTEDLTKFMADKYPDLRKISIDYAVMEHQKKLLVAFGDFGWDDVGTWPAIEKHFPSDEQDNVVIGDAEIMSARSNIVVTEGCKRFTALLGVDDLVVVQTEKATLICRKSEAQNLKKLVTRIAETHDDLV